MFESIPTNALSKKVNLKSRGSKRVVFTYTLYKLFD